MMRSTTIGLLLGFVWLVTGCAKPTLLDRTFGGAYQANREAMVANPDAGHGPGPSGLDPLTAEHVLENYEKGQRAQEHQRPQQGRTNVFVGELGN